MSLLCSNALGTPVSHSENKVLTKALQSVTCVQHPCASHLLPVVLFQPHKPPQLFPRPARHKVTSGSLHLPLPPSDTIFCYTSSRPDLSVPQVSPFNITCPCYLKLHISPSNPSPTLPCFFLSPLTPVSNMLSN